MVGRYSWAAMLVLIVLFVIAQTFWARGHLISASIVPAATVCLLGIASVVGWRNARLEGIWLFHLILTMIFSLMIVTGYPLLLTWNMESEDLGLGHVGSLRPRGTVPTNGTDFFAVEYEAQGFLPGMYDKTFFDVDRVVAMPDPRIPPGSASANSPEVCLLPYITESKVRFWASCPGMTEREMRSVESELGGPARSAPQSVSRKNMNCWQLFSAAAGPNLGGHQDGTEAMNDHDCPRFTGQAKQGETAVAVEALDRIGHWWFSMGPAERWRETAVQAAMVLNVSVGEDAPILRWGVKPADFEAANTWATTMLVALFAVPVFLWSSSWKFFRSRFSG
jgi:hypothetical protein